jgi:hypothetical protein
MKKIFKYLILIIATSAVTKTHAQDKLILKNGTTLFCKIAAISENTITYKDTTANANQVTLSKNDILIAEYKTGEIYMFGSGASLISTETNTLVYETREQRMERKMKDWKEREEKMPNGILGFYLPQILAGRLTVSYERLFANKSIGVTIPVSLTYDMLGVLNSLPQGTTSNTNTSTTSTTSTTNNSSRETQKGVGVITGIDLNYYHDLKPNLKYYFGPRFRYGTAQTFGGIEYLSFQIQNGIMRSRGKRFTSTFGFGIGFFKLSKKYVNQPGYEPNQVYPSGSLTWRLGFRL